ncbi:MAG: UDP-N-acetylmuramoylalanyl-D-glutamyl-2,6-diaminopimelate--D-alanyl-D-alanyl ligase [Glaciihabitans sp.]|nr:UDP-N-acetylmuramoylalanyl-D-glutamyl-2,6-diaminopimelate--D-alanyl-D-alanyl ligase [Glaciihabitans sp.]
MFPPETNVPGRPRTFVRNGNKSARILRRPVLRVSEIEYARGTPSSLHCENDPEPLCPRRRHVIPLRLTEIATVVGGSIAGDDGVTVTGNAVFDSRDVQPGGLFVAFAGMKVDGHDFAERAGRAGAVAVLGSRPTALPTVVVADPEIALQTLAQHVIGRVRSGLTVAAITGSQGKTSTKDLLTAILSDVGPTIGTLGNFNNGLGAPVTLLRVDDDTKYLVVEMGARHLGDIARLTGLVAPDVAIVLNVGKAHIGEFGSQDAIATGKSELVRGLAPGGTAVLNADDPRVLAMASLTDGPVVTFGESERADVRVVGLTLDRLGRPSFTLQTAVDSVPVTLGLVGAHQALNAAAAAAGALAIGVALDAIATSLAAASLSKWRMEVRELADGAVVLNDSYNSSPGSARSSLDALATVEATRRIAVLGEILELGDASEAEHRSVGEYAASRADIVLAVGDNVRPLAAGAGRRGVAVPDNAVAVEWLRANLVAGDVVLIKASRGAHIEEVADALT